MSSSNPDVWLDFNTLYYIRFGDLSGGLHRSEKIRVKQRARSFLFAEGALFQLHMGKRLRVPPPFERFTLIHSAHCFLAHAGVKKTVAFLQKSVFWNKMLWSVREYIAHCVNCRRKNAKPCFPRVLAFEKLTHSFQKVALDVTFF